MSGNTVQLIALFAIPFIALLVPILVGQRVGIYQGKKLPGLRTAPLGTLVGAAFGLFAFMLAFAFQIASGRFDKRKELLLEEVTNIRTTFLRAGLLPEPFRSSIKKQLVEYVDLRAALIKDQAKLEPVLVKSQQILDSCWKHAERLAEIDRSSEVYALYTSSVNDLVANLNQRITMTLQYRIPVTIIGVLFIIAFFSMFILGYHFGISGSASFSIDLALSIIFAVAFFLILALDRPELGLVKINQKPMLTLHDQLHKMI